MDNFSQADFKQYLGLSKFQWSCEILVMWILLTYFYTSPILEVISCSLIAIIFAFQFKGFCNYCHYQNTIPPYFLYSDRNIIYESNYDPLNLEIEQKLNDWAAHESKPFTTQGLTIGDVAKDIGISPYKLSSYLNSNGSNFRSWINNLRIVESKKMLITNKDLSISEIAYSTGFCDLPAFSHAFKKTTGISPKHFKSKLT